MAEVRVPFVDLRAQYEFIQDEVEPGILDILRSVDYIAGQATQQFEAAFAAYTGSAHCLGLGNGTDALSIALLALGAGPGKEVVTVSHSFFATAEAVANIGATVRFVDVNAVTGTIDPTLIDAAVTDKTAVIIAVHLYGRPADMDAVNAVAAAHNLPVIEDAAQAQGAKYKGRPVGSLGDIACFSFYPSKNLGAAGDAGAITTNNAELAEQCRLLANHGAPSKYVHSVVGFNSRLDSIQGVVLKAKLSRLDDWNNARRARAAEYQKLLAGSSDIRLPARDDDDYQGVHHLFAIRHSARYELQKHLSSKGIASAVHYPIGIHRQAAFAEYNSLSLPHTEDWADNELSLPMFETMTTEQVEMVCEALSS